MLLDCLVDGALVDLAELVGVAGALHEEADHLRLRDRVKGDEADVAAREGALAATHLVKHLLGVVAAKHGQLPHGPVAVVIVPLHALAASRALALLPAGAWQSKGTCMMCIAACGRNAVGAAPNGRCACTTWPSKDVTSMGQTHTAHTQLAALTATLLC